MAGCEINEINGFKGFYSKNMPLAHRTGLIYCRLGTFVVLQIDRNTQFQACECIRFGAISSLPAFDSNRSTCFIAPVLKQKTIWRHFHSVVAGMHREHTDH